LKYEKLIQELVESSKQKKAPGRCRRGWEDNIKVELI